MNLLTLERAANLSIAKSNLPSPSEVVEALLAAEKAARKETTHHSLSQLLGTWKLRFITGTKKTRQKAGVVLGAGRYIPQFIEIEITYNGLEKLPDRGRVENSVKLGFLHLTLTGPVKFLPQKNILAFDFTKMTVRVAGLKLYDGYIRNGKQSEQEFFAKKIGEQAFFAYFVLEENFIAARGKGGGLALWSRDN